MPHSWLKIPVNTSDKLRRCMDGDTSKGNAKKCLYSIIERDGVKIERLDFELTGKYAYVTVFWETPQQKLAFVVDTAPVEIVDLADAEEIDQQLRRDP
jgi:hypothetical protein